MGFLYGLKAHPLQLGAMLARNTLGAVTVRLVPIFHARELQAVDAGDLDAEQLAGRDLDRLSAWPAHGPTAGRLHLQIRDPD